MKKSVENTFEAFKDTILDTAKPEEHRLDMFRAALENVERETRHKAASMAFDLANNIHNMEN